MYVRKMPSAGNADVLQMGQTYIYLPATGYRSPYNSDGTDSYDISVKNNNTEGSYWTAGPYIYNSSLYRGYGLSMQENKTRVYGQLLTIIIQRGLWLEVLDL